MQKAMSLDLKLWYIMLTFMLILDCLLKIWVLILLENYLVDKHSEVPLQIIKGLQFSFKFSLLFMRKLIV